MKSPRQEILELLEKLPDNVSFETILAEILFQREVLERTEAVDRGEVISHEEAKKRLAKWLTSNGQ